MLSCFELDVLIFNKLLCHKHAFIEQTLPMHEVGSECLHVVAVL